MRMMRRLFVRSGGLGGGGVDGRIQVAWVYYSMASNGELACLRSVCKLVFVIEVDGIQNSKVKFAF
jgi:hypothetical protein